MNETGAFARGVEGETVKLVASRGGLDDPKTSAIGEAAASFEVSVGRPQLFSMRCRTEYSS